MLTAFGFGALLVATSALVHYETLRLVTGIEALNGLLLVGWSASFTYLAMQRYWSVAERPIFVRRRDAAVRKDKRRSWWNDAHTLGEGTQKGEGP